MTTPLGRAWTHVDGQRPREALCRRPSRPRRVGICDRLRAEATRAPRPRRRVAPGCRLGLVPMTRPRGPSRCSPRRRRARAGPRRRRAATSSYDNPAAARPRDGPGPRAPRHDQRRPQATGPRPNGEVTEDDAGRHQLAHFSLRGARLEGPAAARAAAVLVPPEAGEVGGHRYELGTRGDGHGEGGPRGAAHRGRVLGDDLALTGAVLRGPGPARRPSRCPRPAAGVGKSWPTSSGHLVARPQQLPQAHPEHRDHGHRQTPATAGSGRPPERRARPKRRPRPRGPRRSPPQHRGVGVAVPAVVVPAWAPCRRRPPGGPRLGAAAPSEGTFGPHAGGRWRGRQARPPRPGQHDQAVARRREWVGSGSKTTESSVGRSAAGGKAARAGQRRTTSARASRSWAASGRPDGSGTTRPLSASGERTELGADPRGPRRPGPGACWRWCRWRRAPRP